jgi:transcription initiation factor TFIIH subunit 4
LATTLTSGNAALAGVILKHGNAAEEPRKEVTVVDIGQIEQGFVILETNYKLYAYTGNIHI